MAGPVVAAAVRLPNTALPELESVRDSKALSPKKREELFDVIRRNAVSVAVGWAPSEDVDRLNILRATMSAMRAALDRIDYVSGALVLVDGNQKIPGVIYEQEAVVSGDKKSLSIASASVIAKVVRDRWMCVLDRRYPGYGLARHKGYGTAVHYKALEEKGLIPGLHRKSFLKKLTEPTLS